MALQMRWQPSLLLHQKRKNGPPLGLRNLGNTCYLNSVLQCLTYTPPLAYFCLTHQHSSSCDSAVRKRECPFCILEKQIARSLCVDLSLDTPAKMSSCLRIFGEHFRLGRQEDAHEFLRYVIDACHNTCLRLKKVQQHRRKGGAGEGSVGSTVVKEIFGGALQSQVKCLSCGAESNKVDEIMDISLDVLHSSSLKESLQKFFQAEVLDGNNKYKCDNCKKLVAARKQLSLFQAPNVLVIQLKRFEGIFGGKIDRFIAFEEVLLLSSYMCKGSQDTHPEYNLFGSIVHSGFSPDSGHYYAYIKDAMGCWYCCNDSYVKLTNLQEVLSEQVYILFFSRTKQRPGPVANPDTSKQQNVAYPDQHVDYSSEKENSISSKDNKVSSNVQINLSSFRNSATKKPFSSVNGKIVVQKRQSNGENGHMKASISLQNGEKNMSSLAGYGVAKSKAGEAVDSGKSQTFSLTNGNGKTKRAPANSIEAVLPKDTYLEKEVSKERVTNEHELKSNGVDSISEFSGSKRKLQDEKSCALFAKDADSQAKLEDFKELLRKEASSVLRSCGWTNEVYHFMCSRKKVCNRAAGNMASYGYDFKKSLMIDAKKEFISQIPESLKESLVKRLGSFSLEKQPLGP